MIGAGDDGTGARLLTEARRNLPIGFRIRIDMEGATDKAGTITYTYILRNISNHENDRMMHIG